MDNFKFRSCFSYFISLVTLFSFTIFCVVPQQASAFLDNQPDHPVISYLVDASEYLKSMVKPEMCQRDVDAVILYVVRVNRYIRKTWGFKLDQYKLFKKLKSEIGKSGVDIPKQYQKAFAKRFDQIDNEYSSQEVRAARRALSSECGAKKAKDRHKKDNIPPSLSFSIGVALIGIFLFFIPVPGAKQYGKSLVSMGCASAAAIIWKQVDEDWEAQRDLEERLEREEKINKKNKKNKDGNTVYECSDPTCIYVPDEECPFHLSRKKDRGE